MSNLQLSATCFPEGTAADSSSDWNAPAEHWGNYEEPPVPVVAAAAAAATLQKDQTKVLYFNTLQLLLFILYMNTHKL